MSQRSRRRLVAAASMVAMVGGLVSCSPPPSSVDDALSQIESGKNVRGAFGYLQRQAEEGDPVALLHVANAFETGSIQYEQRAVEVPVEKDPMRAVQLLTRAVDLRVPGSYDELAGFYLTGEHLPVDRPKASRIYDLGVGENDLEARYGKATMLLHHAFMCSQAVPSDTAECSSPTSTEANTQAIAHLEAVASTGTGFFRAEAAEDLVDIYSGSLGRRYVNPDRAAIWQTAVPPEECARVNGREFCGDELRAKRTEVAGAVLEMESAPNGCVDIGGVVTCDEALTSALKDELQDAQRQLE